MAGLTDQGFTPKTFEELQTQLRDSLTSRFAALGETINADPDTRFGQIIDIVSAEFETSWEAFQDIYNAYFPLTATGLSLDNANSLTNTPRIQERSSQAQAFLLGVAGTLVAQNSRVTVENTSNDFLLSSKTLSGPIDPSDYEIASDVVAVFLSNIADEGSLELQWDQDQPGNEVNVTILYTDTAAQIKSKLEAVTQITDVTVLGNLDGTDLGISANFNNFVQIKLNSTTLVSNDLSIGANTLKYLTVDITADPYYCSDDPANLLSQEVGAIAAPIASLINPKDQIVGWNFCYNIDAAIKGRLRETDAEYRLRRLNELSRKGTATAGGIEEAVVEAISSDTFNVSIIENDTDDPIEGALGPTGPTMPGHSIEVFVNALDEESLNNAIAQAIYDSKAAGIQPVSTTNEGRQGSVIDVNGQPRFIPFSSTTSLDIYIIVERTVISGGTYPDDGDDQIKANLVAFFTQYDIGDDVIHHTLYTPVNRVTGMSDVKIFIGKTPNPTLEENIIIQPFEAATTNTSLITVRNVT